jgi:hypothetical protein
MHTRRTLDYEQALIEREHSLSGLETMLAGIAASLTDAEVMRLLRAMVGARAEARRQSLERLASPRKLAPPPLDGPSEVA